MKNYLINYAKWLVASYYQTPGNTSLAIYLSGAPSIPSDKSKYATLLAGSWIDLIAPDYYGRGRSSGVFDPKNVIQTGFDTVQVFKNKLPLVNIYGEHEILPPHYDEFIVIGSSYGWRSTAVLPKFDTDIKEIVLLAPYLESGLGEWEESDEDALRHYLLWYKWIYRLNPDYDVADAWFGFDELWTPSDIAHFEWVNVFVWHGTGDDVISSTRSEQFVRTLQNQFPDWNYKFAPYYGLGHGWSTNIPALQWRLYRKKERREK